jgi:hypothetical protein
VIVSVAGFPDLYSDTLVDPKEISSTPLRFDFPRGSVPSIKAVLEKKHEPTPWQPFVSTFGRDTSGLTIQEITTVEQIPLLGHIYFDSGSAEVPSRYHLYSTREETEMFDEQRLPTDGVAAHAWILDLIGSRLCRNPGTTIQLTGSNSEQPVIGEDNRTADAGSERLSLPDGDLGIDTSRVRLLPSAGWPRFPS